ncbi:hypothetical protein GCM10028809_40910 [Spirosoma gilvum]
MDRIQLRLFASRALLFNVLSCTRFIFVEFKSGHLLLRIYNDRELTDDEKDIYYAVYGELEGDFTGSICGEVDLQVTRAPFEQIDQTGELVYARYEAT